MQRIALELSQDRRPNGFVVWEGLSRHDRKPIVVIITGVYDASQNPKTGPMLQVWVLRQDIVPYKAVQTGEDVSVCNGCSFRASVRKAEGRKGPACYVRIDAGVSQVWKTYKEGRYPTITRQKLAEFLKSRHVRGGAYGNLSNAPLWVSHLWAKNSAGHTQYDHNWANVPQSFASIAMASVSSVAEKAIANEKGWRTFRVKQPHEPPLPDEKECPAQDKFRRQGRFVQCISCLSCSGGDGKNVVIDDHGPGSSIHRAKISSSKMEFSYAS